MAAPCSHRISSFAKGWASRRQISATISLEHATVGRKRMIAVQQGVGASVGLVLEGGGMRGMYTAGVLDVFMEQGISFTHAVGVSAGACFGCNIKSHQIGRAIRYNKAFCADRRYASFGNWLRTGDLYSIDFAYREVPLVRDPFDLETYRADPMRFTVVCTDIQTGEAVYRDVSQGPAEEILDWIRASASIPVLSRPVELEGRKLLDGGVADSIPWKWMLGQGYRKNIVVLTQPAGYRKEPNGLVPFLRVWLRKYPRLVEELADRHERYNANIEELEAAERAGDLFVIRPSESVKAPAMVRDPEVLERIYQVGRRDAAARLDELKGYLGNWRADGSRRAAV